MSRRLSVGGGEATVAGAVGGARCGEEGRAVAVTVVVSAVGEREVGYRGGDSITGHGFSRRCGGGDGEAVWCSAGMVSR